MLNVPLKPCYTAILTTILWLSLQKVYVRPYSMQVSKFTGKANPFRPRIEDTVNDIIQQANYSNVGGPSSCSTNFYRPWRSTRELAPDSYGQQAKTSSQSLDKFNGNLSDRNSENYSMLAPELTPLHQHTCSSSLRFDEPNFSRLTKDCTLVSHSLENEDVLPYISPNARGVSSDFNCNETSRKRWLNPFRQINRFDPPENHLDEPIYFTEQPTCNDQNGLLSRNSPGWHFWQFGTRPHPGACPPIHAPTLRENIGISSSTPSSRFRNSHSPKSNLPEPFGHTQDCTDRVLDCSPLLDECWSSFLTRTHRDFLGHNHPFGNPYVSIETDKSNHCGNGGRTDGSFSSSLIADLTKEWSPHEINRADDNNVKARKERLQSISIQTENVISANTAVQTYDYPVICQECKKLRSRLDKVLHHSVNDLGSNASHVNFERFYTSTPRFPPSSSHVDIGFVSPLANRNCTRLDFQKNVKTGPPMIFPKNGDNRLVCKGLDLSDSNED